jgi:SAM-dependent methyltransferase
VLEQEKYQAVWAHPAYRAESPGERSVEIFLRWAEPKKGQTLRDLGCGTGRGGQALSDYGLDVTLYDFTTNSVDPGINLPFVQHDLNKPIEGRIADFAYCCDVMEHLPTDEVERVLENVVKSAFRVYLQICCVDDHLGALIGEPLHLTVKPAAWWREKLEAMKCVILKEDDCISHCAFLVSGYADAKEFGEFTVLNVSDDTVTKHIRANLEAGYEEVQPYAVQDVPLMILAGGPTLSDFEDEIIERRKAGEFLVTVNNTHQWCRERGIEPSMHIMCDAREFNKRFVDPPFERTRYLIASQCHPSVAASLPKDNVRLWHAGDHLKDTIQAWDAEHGKSREWYPIFGGGTVMLRAFPLLMMLGFRKYELFGFDSCLRWGEHHAYSQPENDRRMEMTVRVGSRDFLCHPWMVAQAGDFLKLMKILAPHIDLCVRGDSLISHILTTAAEDE